MWPMWMRSRHSSKKEDSTRRGRKLSLAECGHIDLRAEEIAAITRFLAQQLQEVKAIEFPQEVPA
jgi:hypothetical protein